MSTLSRRARCCCDWTWCCRCWPRRWWSHRPRCRSGFGQQERPYALLPALGVALTAIPWSRWQLAVPLLGRRPAGRWGAGDANRCL